MILESLMLIHTGVFDELVINEMGCTIIGSSLSLCIIYNFWPSNQAEGFENSPSYSYTRYAPTDVVLVSEVYFKMPNPQLRFRARCPSSEISNFTSDRHQT